MLLLQNLNAQDSLPKHIEQRFVKKVDQKTVKLQEAINTKSKRLLNWALKKEKRMMSRLQKSDSVAARNIFTASMDSLQNMKAALLQKTGKYRAVGEQYSSYLDTLQVAGKFLNNIPFSDHLKKLDGEFDQAQYINNYLQNRQQELKAQLTGYTTMTGQLGDYSKKIYYYKAQVGEYRELLNDRKKMEATGMALLRKLPAFSPFFDKYSKIAGLFNLGENFNANRTAEGLQNRDFINAFITEKVGSGPTAGELLNQKMEEGKTLINKYASRYANLDNPGEMPDFKPNPMKSRSFLRRLEYGYNFQYQRSKTIYPTIMDLGGQVGYKCNKKWSAGIGASMKIAMERWHLNASGLSLRTYADYQLKGTLFASGGMELNYNSTFAHIRQFKDWRGWQAAALMGICKKYTIKGKMKGTVMVLYDFMASRQTPYTMPLKFRVGRTF